MEPTAQHMPPCNYFSVPKWDKSKPRELTQYFKELEYLFRDCGITEHTKMKEYVARYVMYNTAEIWTGLPEFAATTTPVGNQASTAISYKNGKEAVIHLYPGTEESMRYMIARRLKILKPTHHLKDPYNVKDVYEAGNWHLKVTDMSLGIPCAKEILLVTTQPQVTNNTVTTNSYIKKEDMEAAISTAVASAMTHIETMINTQLSTPRTPNAANSLCHFCGELDHTMSRGRCNTLEQYICLERIRCGADSKVVLSTGARIPNYSELKSYQERVFDGVEILRPKQLLKGYKPMAAVVNDPAPPASEAPTAPPSTVAADNTPTIANTPDSLPPLHPYSGLNNCYQPPAQQNFCTLDK
ncbi:hypothetical protein C0993_012336 [Termitomyces sp. T159_Od127]|nr:hypothetical protein C0993_012336 [Termitomyces sp. T159_Od127]